MSVVDRPLRAVMFDMDGTICDSEPLWIAAEFALAERYDAEWSTEDGLRLVGNSLPYAGAYIRERMGLELTPDEIVDLLVDHVVAGVHRDGVDWRPGALELLHACNDAGVPTALVTMAYRRFAGAIASVMPMGRFDVVVTGDEVDNGKPAPDPYLRAAAMLGVEPRDCVAVEDSPPGAASAEAAGCVVVAVPHQVAIPLTPRRTVVRSLADVRVADLRALMSEANSHTRSPV